MKNVVLLEPYYTGSHKLWADDLKKYSKHKITILSMKGQYWKWRMHGSAITLANQLLKLSDKPDIVLATDMLDLSTFLALTRKTIKNIPVVMYFHENQLSYPWPSHDRDLKKQTNLHYGFINFVSALTADLVLFNSNYHRDQFLKDLEIMLKHFPDYHELDSIKTIRQKSRVVYLGLDLNKFKKYKALAEKNNPPAILWNHRWEYDKNPDDFYYCLLELEKKQIDFKLILLGRNYSQKPNIYDTITAQFETKILHAGYSDTFRDYAKWLWQADIIPITNIQDFFGISLIEAVYCDCIPILPKRLSYPEIFPSLEFPQLFYSGLTDLVLKLEKFLSESNDERQIHLQKIAAKFDWENMIEKYDSLFSEL